MTALERSDVVASLAPEEFLDELSQGIPQRSTEGGGVMLVEEELADFETSFG